MWYAKRPLPGAAPSVDYQFDDADTPLSAVFEEEPQLAAQSPQTDSSVSSNQPRQRAVDLQALMAPAENNKSTTSQKGADLGDAPKVARAESTIPQDLNLNDGAVQEEGTETENATSKMAGDSIKHIRIECNLGVWSTEHYLLISHWSDEASERLQNVLAHNVLKALDKGEVDDRRMLHWPVFRNPHIPGNSPEDFRDVLTSVVSGYSERSIILLGVLTEENEEDRQRYLKPVLPRVGVDFPYSLAEISTTPDHKRNLWDALKSYYRV